MKHDYCTFSKKVGKVTDVASKHVKKLLLKM